jgi:hypothetical protein
MDRRDLLKAFGAATALSLVPRDAIRAWDRVASGLRPADGLTPAQLALVGAVADTILPRTDTPSATDVRVPAFVDVVVSENYDEAERTAFVAGLAAIDAAARSGRAAAFSELDVTARGAVIESIEAGNRRDEPARSYWRLKSLVVHGYFTSEPVMKDVLKWQVMPGRFDGAAPMPHKGPVVPTQSSRGGFHA